VLILVFICGFVFLHENRISQVGHAPAFTDIAHAKKKKLNTCWKTNLKKRGTVRDEKIQHHNTTREI